jgi:hypothetical protein
MATGSRRPPNPQAALFDDAPGPGEPGRRQRPRLDDFRDAAQAIDQLFRDALWHDGSDAFDQFLTFAARFSNLSVYNAMLVRVQRPGAAAVATRRKWESAGGHIRPDAVPIVILRPFGPVAFVYESADVEGISFPGEERSALFADGPVPEAAYEKMRVAARERRIDVRETDQYGPLLAGTAAAMNVLPDLLSPSRQGALWRVQVNARHDLATRFATLAHELGHVYCGHLGAHPNGAWPDRRKAAATYAQREMEAEAVCWLVCQRNGVTSRSKDYLHSLIKLSDLEQVSLYAIFYAANRVEGRTL